MTRPVLRCSSKARSSLATRRFSYSCHGIRDVCLLSRIYFIYAYFLHTELYRSDRFDTVTATRTHVLWSLTDVKPQTFPWPIPRKPHETLNSLMHKGIVAWSGQHEHIFHFRINIKHSCWLSRICEYVSAKRFKLFNTLSLVSIAMSLYPVLNIIVIHIYLGETIVCFHDLYNLQIRAKIQRRSSKYYL